MPRNWTHSRRRGHASSQDSSLVVLRTVLRSCKQNLKFSLRISRLLQVSMLHKAMDMTKEAHAGQAERAGSMLRHSQQQKLGRGTQSAVPAMLNNMKQLVLEAVVWPWFRAFSVLVVLVHSPIPSLACQSRFSSV